MKKSIVWFRKDLRLHDHPALWEAARQGIVIPVFIQSQEEEKEDQSGEASDWWLHHSLLALQQNLASKGLSLIIRSGNTLEEMTQLIDETGADAVFFNERYAPSAKKRDRLLIASLKSKGVEVRKFHGHLLFDPDSLWNKKGEPYKVFTSFWRRCMQVVVSLPLPVPEEWTALEQSISTLSVGDLGLLPTIRLDLKFHVHWEPGETAAIERWQQFADDGLEQYAAGRDIPSKEAVSFLSPYLAHGDISVKAIWHAAKRLSETASSPSLQQSVEAFLKQLVWREFAYHQLIHFPTIIQSPLRAQFQAFPWQGTKAQLRQWQQGLTGYPLVDAGMRELGETGAMHNRVRMVVASFLVKHLLIPWTEGSEWFKETLVDFDDASNAMGWQWVAGCGIDTAPYFRIFNPIIQSEKFDRNGVYIRRWVPELDGLALKYIHRPWEAPADVLMDAGIELGLDYPLPMVEHSFARVRALEAYNTIKLKG